MKELIWKDAYLLGVPELDLQHKHIFDCFVTIAAEGLTRHDRWLADSSIVQLVSLVQAHFALEESLMRILRYPELEQHIEEHRQFHADVHELAQKSLRTKGSVSRAAVRILHTWLHDHIATSDRRYADYFAGPVSMCVGA
jgi:hemerythrin